MKILTAAQIKEADSYTIQNEPISSIDLMERASTVIAEWISDYVDKQIPLFFLIGKGNNGGDGLAVARLLYQAGYNCLVHVVYEKDQLREDCRCNLERLPEGIRHMNLDDISSDTIVIDALLGTGVSGGLKEPLSALIDRANALPNQVISIDLPSGMISEFRNKNQQMIKADITLTIELPKLAMLLPEAGENCGDVDILPIGLSRDFIDNVPTKYHYITEDFIRSIILKRNKFAHKGTYGHALLICGSWGMSGAAVLATGGALRSGCGLVTLHIPYRERYAVQTRYPSAILSLDEDYCFSELPPNLNKYTTIGIGPGLGQAVQTKEALKELLNNVYHPIVIDADALNIIADNPKLKQHIPVDSILTPHPGELRRLIGEWQTEEQKVEMTKKLSSTLQSVVIVKGAYTMICLPDGNCYFNSTGNSGMAKGGSGDVLMGYITGLLARGYTSAHAAILGVYMHGLAGDKAADAYGVEAMNSGDIIEYLG